MIDKHKGADAGGRKEKREAPEGARRYASPSYYTADEGNGDGDDAPQRTAGGGPGEVGVACPVPKRANRRPTGASRRAASNQAKSDPLSMNSDHAIL